VINTTEEGLLQQLQHLSLQKQQQHKSIARTTKTTAATPIAMAPVTPIAEQLPSGLVTDSPAPLFPRMIVLGM